MALHLPSGKHFWLVVSTPLKKKLWKKHISQLGLLFPTEWKIMLLHNYGTKINFQWAKQLFRLGHFLCRKQQ
jgi:hypothetical protein